MRPNLFFVLLQSLLLLLSACQTTSKVTQAAQGSQGPQSPVEFALQARFSVVAEGRAQQGSLYWRYAKESEQIEVSGPLGLNLMRGERHQGGVFLTLLGGEQRKAASWETAFADLLTVSLPFSQAAQWLVSPEDQIHAGEWQVHITKRDARGRPIAQVWRQTGASPIELKLFIDEWE
ncbi:MAG: hypothetical protein RLZZ502_914 [Pseudomonadota bacterium]